MNHTDTLHTRRQFLRTSVLGGAVSWTLPLFLENTFSTLDAMAADSAVQTATGKDHPILVVLQLAGGNDGLNTVIPYADDAYYLARPRLGIRGDKALKINDYLALNSNLSGLKGLYDEGHMALLQGVGYPNPNRSHFRSTDIWQTATDANEYDNQGWIGRYFDACCKGDDPTVGVAVGKTSPLAFASKGQKGISFSKPEEFRFKTEKNSDPAAVGEFFRDHNDDSDTESGSSIAMLGGSNAGNGSDDTLDFLRRTSMDAQLSSDKVLEITKGYKSAVSYPGSQLASSLSLVSRLIAGGLPTRVYYVAQGGYDTHSGQAGAHDKLMMDLDASLKAFVADLKSQGNFNRVVVMTFSEFGRRVAENNSGGTDHGAAAPMFVLGGGVKPGIYGQQPSLSKLDSGDLIYNVDFRSVYASVLDNWLKAPSEQVLKRKFSHLPFI